MTVAGSSETQCAICGLELGHPNAPCPNCLPNFPGTKRMVTSKTLVTVPRAALARLVDIVTGRVFASQATLADTVGEINRAILKRGEFETREQLDFDRWIQSGVYKAADRRVIQCMRDAWVAARSAPETNAAQSMRGSKVNWLRMYAEEALKRGQDNIHASISEAADEIEWLRGNPRGETNAQQDFQALANRYGLSRETVVAIAQDLPTYDTLKANALKANASPADVVGALQDKVHEDTGAVQPARSVKATILPGPDLACEGFVPDPHSRFCDRCGYPEREHRRAKNGGSSP